MQLFYNPDIQTTTSSLTFSKEESRHIVRVLRKKENDILHITNGLGYLFEARVTFATDKKCVVEIISATKTLAKPHVCYASLPHHLYTVRLVDLCCTRLSLLLRHRRNPHAIEKQKHSQRREQIIPIES